MPTFQIHIKGLVQGVGFRPHVYRLAEKEKIKGWVINGPEGVIIKFNAINSVSAQNWMRSIITEAPQLSRIASSELKEVEHKDFDGFSIRESSSFGQIDIPLTPDFAMCPHCKAEIENGGDRRFNYVFITCTHCGPRYSITSKVPYDRPTTTMDQFVMCPSCQSEYNDPKNRRHFSQTNSCPNCGIQLEIYDSSGKVYLAFDQEKDKIDFITSKIEAGQIVALKGIGGYLLICDAGNDKAISFLRKRKHRPNKPLAVMYPDVHRVRKYFHVSEKEIEALTSPEAPIVLLSPKKHLNLSADIAPGLSSIGVMLPYAPLLYLVSKQSNIPLVATSGNISGSPIIYEDEKAIEELTTIADWIVTHNREILIPQDDSVLRFSPKNGKRIILRRSRGFAPNYFGLEKNLDLIDDTLAVGAEMKGAFAFVNKGRVYISQYLGNMTNYYSQVSFEKILDHFKSVLGFVPEKLVYDLHPSYFGHGWCLEKSLESPIHWNQYQHHEAHFASVLGENNLLESDNPILGFIWDGTGLSPENQVWGSETFLWNGSQIQHQDNIGLVPHLSGDQMALQPRLSLLAFTDDNEDQEKYIKPFFKNKDWNSFKFIKEKSKIKTSSMGRLFDAVSCLLTDTSHNSFEGQAAMRLETLATEATDSVTDVELEKWDLNSNEPFYRQALRNVLGSLDKQMNKSIIAYLFHDFLVKWIRYQASKTQVKKLAFSGGVFQNALVVDMIISQLSSEYELYFHKELSPNDENIAHGQLMLETINMKRIKSQKREERVVADEIYQ